MAMNILAKDYAERALAEDKAAKRAKAKITEINAKRSMPSPSGALPSYDGRTIKEVAVTRENAPVQKIIRLARKARGSLGVRVDSDGAYRLGVRLDGGSAT